jgi:hypothetical protein
MRDSADNPKVLFWLIILLCLPVVAAPLIVISAIMHPNASAHLLIPVVFIAPTSLVGAIAVTLRVRQSMPRQRLRFAFLAILLAVSSCIAALFTISRAVE